MIEEQVILDESLLARNAPLPAVSPEFRCDALQAAQEAITVRRRHRQQLAAGVAIACLACLSIWRIRVTEIPHRHGPHPGAIGSNPQSPSLGVPQSAPVVDGNPSLDSPLVPVHPASDTAAAHQGPPAGKFQGPILSLMGMAEMGSLEEQLQNRGELLRQVFQAM